MHSAAEQFEVMEDKFAEWLRDPTIREEYIRDMHRIQNGEMTPGVLRWWMKFGFEAGYRRRVKEQLNGH